MIISPAEGDQCDARNREFDCSLFILCYAKKKGEISMKIKINEDWLATIIAFVLLGLAVVNIISPEWMKF